MKKNKSSLENALHLLKLFSMDTPELSVTEIADKLGVAKSTAHRLLSSLVQEEFVYKDPHTNLYSLGLSILKLVEIINSQIHISNEAIPILNSLVEQIGENAHLGIIDGTETVILQTIRGNYTSYDNIHLGKRLPTYCTSAGKAILSYHPSLIYELLNHLKPYTRYTITNPNKLQKELSLVRKNGYAISEREYLDNIMSIGVPVYNESNEVIASISITADIGRVSHKDTKEKYINLLKEAGRNLTDIIIMRRKGRSQ